MGKLGLLMLCQVEEASCLFIPTAAVFNPHKSLHEKHFGQATQRLVCVALRYASLSRISLKRTTRFTLLPEWSGFSPLALSLPKSQSFELPAREAWRSQDQTQGIFGQKDTVVDCQRLAAPQSTMRRGEHNGDLLAYKSLPEKA